ncbi:hypothetical protein MKX01_017226 [Papaver californicum]|nr:hypothetical protein MKX01_017226 [Papaver californicum]
MDYHSLTRKELQILCKKNKIRANMTNFAMADTLSSLPKVRGVEGNGNSTPGTPLLTSTSRKSKATTTKPLSDLVDNNEPKSSSSDLARHTLSPLANLYRSDIIIPKEVHVVDHPHCTRLAKRLKQSARKVEGKNDAINIEMLHGEEKDEEMRTKYEVTDDVLPYNKGNKFKVSNEEQDEVGTGNVPYIMVYAESLKLAKSGDMEEFTVGDQDDTIEETSTTSIMGGVSRDKIAHSLNGCSSEVSYAPVSAEKSWNIARTLVGCISEISSAPMVSSEKSMKVVCDLNEPYVMGEETVNIKDPNEDQDMESKDQPIQVSESSLMVEKAEILEASNVDDEKSKLMCEIELCNVKVTEIEAENSSNVNDDISGAVEKLTFSPSVTGLIANQIPLNVAAPTRTTSSDDKVQGTTPLISYTNRKAVTIPIISAGKSMNIAHAFVGCTSELSSAPMISAEKSMNNALVCYKSSLVGEETENTKEQNEQNMETIDQPIEVNEVVGFKSAHDLEVKFVDENELSNLNGTEVETKYVDESFLMVERAENLEDSNVDDGKSKLTCEVGFYGVKVTEVEEDNEEDGSNVNNDISDVLEKFSLYPAATGPIVNQIPVHAASPTRATASENQVQETTPLISYITKKAATTPKGSIEVLNDKRGVSERGKCSASTSKVVTELVAEQKHSKGENNSQGKLKSTSIGQLKKMIKLTHLEKKNTIVELNKEIRPEKHENKGENTIQRKLKATSLRRLKKTIKQLIQSDNKNITVKLNKKVVPENDENKDQNTAQKELKATSARQLKKMIKQRTQTTKTPLPSLILAE